MSGLQWSLMIGVMPLLPVPFIDFLVIPLQLTMIPQVLPEEQGVAATPE